LVQSVIPMSLYGSFGRNKTKNHVLTGFLDENTLAIATDVSGFTVEWERSDLMLELATQPHRSIMIERVLRSGSEDLVQIPGDIAIEAVSPLLVRAIANSGSDPNIIEQPAAVRIVSMAGGEVELEKQYDWGHVRVLSPRIDERRTLRLSPIMSVGPLPLGRTYGLGIRLSETGHIGRLIFEHDGAVKTIALLEKTTVRGTLVSNGTLGMPSAALIEWNFAGPEWSTWNGSELNASLKEAGTPGVREFVIELPETIGFVEQESWPPGGDVSIEVFVDGFTAATIRHKIAIGQENVLPPINLEPLGFDLIVRPVPPMLPDQTSSMYLVAYPGGEPVYCSIISSRVIGDGLHLSIDKSSPARVQSFQSEARVLLVADNENPVLLTRTDDGELYFDEGIMGKASIRLRGQEGREGGWYGLAWRNGKISWVIGDCLLESGDVSVTFNAPRGETSLIVFRDTGVNPGSSLPSLESAVQTVPLDFFEETVIDVSRN